MKKMIHVLIWSGQAGDYGPNLTIIGGGIYSRNDVETGIDAVYRPVIIIRRVCIKKTEQVTSTSAEELTR